jgi:nicotinamidase-related amidase
MMTSTTQLDPRQTALIIVDLQNDFVSEGGAYHRGGAASDVAASQFTLWPDAQGEPMISPHLRNLRPFLRRGDFVAGSQGHATVAALDDLVDVSVWKVAYSAFFNTQLDWVLRRAGIEVVAICGIVTNGGVASTARDAHMRDYRVLVLGDGCAASTQAAHDAALADLCTVGEVTTCEAFQGRLGA